MFIEEMGILFLLVMVISFFVKLLRQPIIIGYVLSGFIASVFLIDTQLTRENIIILSELGITFLLFFMGLEFDLKSLKHMGKDIILSSFAQSIIFFLSAFSLTFLFDFTMVERVYLSIIFMFSSTLLVAKWLEDKKDTASLYGKITLGMLIVQDIIAIIAITFLGVVQEKSWIKILIAPVGGIMLVLIALGVSKYLLNYPLKFASKSPELLFVSSMGICFLFVEIAPLFGYSMTIGAFIAGIVLANTLYKREIISRLKPLIIFFNMLFFVGLGFQINYNLDLSFILFILLLTLLSLIFKPIVIYLTLKWRGYDAKTAFLSAIHLAQLSEFGIIILAGGVFSGAINSIFGAVGIFSLILTLLISSYFIKYARKMFSFFEPLLLKIDKLFFKKEFKTEQKEIKCNILFFGYHELSKELYNKFESIEKKILVIENDPTNIDILKKEGIRHIYHSIRDTEFIDHINLEKVELLISSILDVDDTILIIKHLKEKNPKAVAIVTAKSLKNALELYDNNADYVIYPSYINEQHVSVLLEDYTKDINTIISKKIAEITKLKEKQIKQKKENTNVNFIDEGFNNIINKLPSFRKKKDSKKQD